MSCESEFEHADLWQDDGHVTELVVTFVADGQDELLPEEVTGHVDTCQNCTERVADAAELSFSLGAELLNLDASSRVSAERPDVVASREVVVEPAFERPPAQKAAPFPWLGVAAAVAVAMLAALPEISRTPTGAVRMVGWLRDAPGFIRAVLSSLPVALDQMGASLSLVSMVATLLLIAMAWTVTHRSQDSTFKGRAS